MSKIATDIIDFVADAIKDSKLSSRFDDRMIRQTNNDGSLQSRWALNTPTDHMEILTPYYQNGFFVIVFNDSRKQFDIADPEFPDNVVNYLLEKP